MLHAYDILPRFFATQPTHVLKGDVPFQSAIKQARERLFVVPSDGDLDEASARLVGRRAAYYSLRNALRELQGIDLVLIDHAGAYTPVMEACLLASNSILIPSELEPYATQGLFNMFNKLKETLVDHQLENQGIIRYCQLVHRNEMYCWVQTRKSIGAQ